MCQYNDVSQVFPWFNLPCISVYCLGRFMFWIKIDPFRWFFPSPSYISIKGGIEMAGEGRKIPLKTRSLFARPLLVWLIEAADWSMTLLIGNWKADTHTIWWHLFFWDFCTEFFFRNYEILLFTVLLKPDNFSVITESVNCNLRIHDNVVLFGDIWTCT